MDGKTRTEPLEEDGLENLREVEGDWRTWNLGSSRAGHLAYSYLTTREPPVP